MPWGNRSLLFRDPDGNLVNLFSPVTPEAIKRLEANVSRPTKHRPVCWRRIATKL